MSIAGVEKQIMSFKTINPVIAPFNVSGRSSLLVREDKFKMEAKSDRFGIEYSFPGEKIVRLTPWSNIVEVTYAR